MYDKQEEEKSGGGGGRGWEKTKVKTNKSVVGLFLHPLK